jgi:hypothetical protein
METSNKNIKKILKDLDYQCSDPSYWVKICREIKHEDPTFKFPENILHKIETIISKDSTYSYLYASCVLEGPFLLGEPTMSEHCWISISYAENILKGRFKMAEPLILSHREDDDIQEEGLDNARSYYMNMLSLLDE